MDQAQVNTFEWSFNYSPGQRWCLENDLRLLTDLETVAQKLTDEVSRISSLLGGLECELMSSYVDVRTITSRLQVLADTQFVENRVYEEDLDNIHHSTTDVPSSSTQCPSITESLEECLRVTKAKCSPIDGSEANQHLMYIRKPKVSYTEEYERQLPWLIGSREFMNSPSVGVSYYPLHDNEVTMEDVSRRSSNQLITPIDEPQLTTNGLTDIGNGGYVDDERKFIPYDTYMGENSHSNLSSEEGGSFADEGGSLGSTRSSLNTLSSHDVLEGENSPKVPTIPTAASARLLPVLPPMAQPARLPMSDSNSLFENCDEESLFEQDEDVPSTHPGPSVKDEDPMECDVSDAAPSVVSPMFSRVEESTDIFSVEEDEDDLFSSVAVKPKPKPGPVAQSSTLPAFGLSSNIFANTDSLFDSADDSLFGASNADSMLFGDSGAVSSPLEETSTPTVSPAKPSKPPKTVSPPRQNSNFKQLSSNINKLLGDHLPSPENPDPPTFSKFASSKPEAESPPPARKLPGGSSFSAPSTRKLPGSSLQPELGGGDIFFSNPSAPTLQSLCKDRPRHIGKKPPSRKFLKLAHPEVHSVKSEIRTLDESERSEPSPKAAKLSSPLTALSPSTDEDDLFETSHPGDGDLFATGLLSTSNTIDNIIKGTSGGLGTAGPNAAVNSFSSGFNFNDDDDDGDLFSDSVPAAPSSSHLLSTPKPDLSNIFDHDDEDDDIFSSSLASLSISRTAPAASVAQPKTEQTKQPKITGHSSIKWLEESDDDEDLFSSKR